MQKINRAAVLGAGVMGATIAAHLANAGLDVLLLDIVPKDANPEDKSDRNRFAQNALKNLAGMKPAAFFLRDYAHRIEVGNLEDDVSRLGECDWVIEVIIENLDIKKSLLANTIAPNIKEGAVISSNTSGLSINSMAEALPENLRKNFMVTHFFNPPRYMKLLEIIPCKETDPGVVTAMAEFIRKRLGKGIVYAKDTPNFVANRIGVYAIYNSFKHMLDMGLNVEQVDAVSGPATARPKSAAYRTCDLVGIDTLAHIGDNTYGLLTEDEEREIYKTPDFVKEMVKKGLHGNKTKQGFYKKTMVEGERQILYYDYPSGEYKPVEKPKFPSVQSGKLIDDPGERLKAVLSGKDDGALFAWRNLRDTLIYAFNRIPEIADDIVNVDNGMKWGFNWEIGPFEMLDALGVSYFVERAEKEGVTVPEKMKGIERFYKFEEGKKFYFDIVSGEYREMTFSPEEVNLEILKKSGGVIEKNNDCSLLDLGDGVFCLEFHSKMNSIGGGILNETQKATKRAEQDGVGLVIANRGANFSVGANIMLLAIAIAEGEYDDINMMIKAFQKATMAIKYSSVPVVVAPFQMALGGGCEYALHGDARIAHAETYMGLVEVGVGLLPAGGGTKELAIRAVKMAEKYETDVSPFMFKNFKNIGLAKVSMSAEELFEMGYMVDGDAITMNLDNLIHDAKKKVLSLACNYRPSKPLVNIKAAGRSVAASMKSQLWNMKVGGYATEYEEYIGGVIADVMGGGDVPAGTLITEEYLLDLEREGFLKLCGNKKTAERIQHMLKKGKPLRN